MTNRKLLGLTAFFAAGLVAAGFSGCSFLNELLDATNVDATGVAKKISDADYTAVDKETMTVSSDKDGKVAYLVKVNLGGTKANASTTGNSRAVSEEAEGAEYTVGGPRTFTLPEDFTRESLGRVLTDEEAAARESRGLNSSYSVGDTEKFHLGSSGTGNASSTSTATLKYVSGYFYIWYVSSSKNFIKESSMDFKTLGNKLDTIFPLEKKIFGSNVPKKNNFSELISVSESDKIHVIVYDIDNDAQEGNKSGTYGFVSTVNMYTPDSTSGKKYNSNGAQILYLDSYLLQLAPEKIWSTSAHELQHLLGFIQKQINTQGPEFSTWFTEMLSLVSEEIFQEILGVSDDNAPFISRKDFSCSATNWGIADECWSKAPTGSFEYANTYMFGTYLMRHYGGLQLIHEIATNNYGKEEAITQALKTCGFTEDFYDVLAKFGQIYVNASGNNSALCTLNKAYTTNFDGKSYSFKKLNLTEQTIPASAYTNEWKSYVSTGAIAGTSKFYKKPSGNRISLPIYLKGTSDGQVELYQYGTSVHCLGKVSTGTKLKFELPKDDDVLMFLTYMGN